MATVPTTQPQTMGRLPGDTQELRIVSHSGLFYWWPVWACGFLMGILSFFGGGEMAILPGGTTVHQVDETKYELLTKADRTTESLKYAAAKQEFKLRASDNKNYGVIYAFVLLLVILITNVPLRGLWSVIVIIVLVLTSVIFATLGWWADILRTLNLLEIHINAGGYIFISLGLLVMWAVTFFFFDRQIYMVFTPGQFKVCLEIGGGETSYDTMGMVIQKQRNDLFRHLILGLGSGDLIVRTSGANAHEFQMHNVLFVGHKLKLIEDMQRERPVVQG